MPIIEERDALVTLTLRITTRVTFVAAERDRKITNSDFIDNAVGAIPASVFEDLEGEAFEIAYPIEGEVHDDEPRPDA